MDEVSIIIANELEQLHLATAFSREVCRSVNSSRIDDKFTNTVELVVSEAVTNAIKHSDISDLTKNILISFQIHQDRLVINVKDQGRSFDFEKIPEPEFEKHPEGGYGVFIIESSMDKVEYKEKEGEGRRSDDYNVLSMTKYFGKL